MPESTGRSVGSDKPRFTVEGEAQGRLTVDLVRLEASHDEEGMARLEVVLRNWGQPHEGRAPDFLYLDGQILELGRSIEVSAGEGDEETVIFSGKITAVAGLFPERRPPELRVHAEDALQQARMRQRTRYYERLDEAGIVSRVARDHGLRGRADAEGTEHKELWQVNQSDLAFLRERARAADARLEVGGGELRFLPRRAPGEEAITLSKEGNLLRFEASADLAHQRTRVAVHGYSVADKEAIHEAAEASELRAESRGGRTGPELLDELGWEAVEHLHLEAPATRSEARALARAEMRRRGRRFLVGRGTTSGTPKLKVGSEVELLDVGGWFSGRWSVCAVRHTFDLLQGLRTHFEAERVDRGRSS
ncbi:phage late control D family protein [Sorangium sp. So ce1182]|uniref:phage late control D family protein n=1 Tax=Sorangium sp. So ce1182 TaxID=3133334 RepID=UPI003F6008E1